jgi:hypothetical protein
LAAKNGCLHDFETVEPRSFFVEGPFRLREGMITLNADAGIFGKIATLLSV